MKMLQKHYKKANIEENKNKAMDRKNAQDMRLNIGKNRSP